VLLRRVERALDDATPQGDHASVNSTTVTNLLGHAVVDHFAAIVPAARTTLFNILFDEGFQCYHSDYCIYTKSALNELATTAADLPGCRLYDQVVIVVIFDMTASEIDADDFRWVSADYDRQAIGNDPLCRSVSE